MTALLKRCICLIVFIPRLCTGQLSDDFSDGNFTSGPPWGGNAQKFIINTDLQLQLYDDEAGTADLFTPIHLFNDMEWRFWVRESFSPSANNHARVYLLAESDLTTEMPDGIFVLLGESGSNDAVRLMRQTSGDTSTLIRGSPGAIASSFICSLKVLLLNDTIKLFADYTGGENFLPQGKCPLHPAPGTRYLGVHCKYTSSNSKKFYFDDFYTGPIQYDTIAPWVHAIRFVEPDQLEALFSESLDRESAEERTNYQLVGTGEYPELLVLNESDPSRVSLHFSDSLPYGKLLQINISGVSDISGNLMSDTILWFSRYDPLRYELVINEIMADPSPPVQLPEYEFLELFNTSPHPLDLTGWTMVVGESEKALTGAHIEPGGYLIIGKKEAAVQLGIYGNYFGLESFSLTNATQNIMLFNEKGELICGVNYHDQWYGDDEKAEGGWSLEQINPYNPCLASENWLASKNNKGGSPGSGNSVFDDFFVAPVITRVCAIDSLRIRVEFNQSMHRGITLAPQIFSIDKGAGAIMAILPDDPYFTSFILYPEHHLLEGIIYQLSCQSDVSNCVGDTVFISEKKLLGLPCAPEWQDLVINEVLFNPFPGGDDYVEVYNRSEKPVSLNGISIASVKINPPAPPDTSAALINEDCRVLMPGEYAFFCKHYADVDNFYFCQGPKACLEIEGFPAYGNEKGIILLQDEKGGLLDVFSYHEEMQYPLLNIVEGVALERLHPDRPTSDPTNWHSASQLSGFGTPGYINSQFIEMNNETANIRISPKVCSPGYDGHDDQIGIHYHFDRPGYLASIIIFNAAGQLVRNLVNNELLGTSGIYTWNGIDDNSSKVPAGMYVILIELTDINGKIVRYKKTAVVAPG